MTLFIDDVSNPKGNHRAEQPILELLRQLVEHRTVCALEKEKRGEMKTFENVQYVLAMSNISEGKRTENISQRFLRHFFIYNVLPPSVTMVHEIYGQMLRGRFIEASTAMQSVVDCLPYFMNHSYRWRKNIINEEMSQKSLRNVFCPFPFAYVAHGKNVLYILKCLHLSSFLFLQSTYCPVLN